MQELIKVKEIKDLEKIDYSGRFYIGYYNDQVIFLKVEKSSSDHSIPREYDSGIKINSLKSDYFIKTIDLLNYESGDFFGGSKFKFPRKVLITEYINEPTLSQVLYNLSFIKILEIFLQIAVVIWHANKELGFYHKDLHSGNIVVKEYDSPILHKIDNIEFYSKFKIYIYDFGRTIFHSQAKKYVVSDLRKLLNSIGARFKKEVQQILNFLLDWEQTETDVNFLFDKFRQQWKLELRYSHLVNVNLDKVNIFEGIM